MKDLVLFTESYPYGGVTEPGFVEPEIEALSREFTRVTLVPLMRCGEAAPLPPNVVVDNTMLRRPGTPAKLAGLFRPEVWRRLWADRSRIGSVRQLRAALAFSIHVLHCERQLRGMGFDTDATLFYTFWFDIQTAAVARLGSARLVTRAHGYDVYEERSPFLSHSWRRDTLRRIVNVFPASENLASRLALDYPEAISKIEVRYLGCAGPAAPRHLLPAADDDAVRLLSVARVAPEKGVLRQIGLLKEVAARNPQMRIDWTHVGDGPLMAELRRACATLPANLHVALAGALDNAAVHRLMHTGRFDALVQLSVSEPLGIVLCEAMSHGIPVIATCVGGIPEVVDSSVGVLLPPEPDADGFADALQRVRAGGAAMGVAARRRWAQKFDAARNRSDFAEELAVISE